MKVYLMRHGDATHEPGNPLSPKGRKDAEAVAAFLLVQGVSIATIEHSTKLRAQQTAQILAEKLHPSGGVAETEGVAPLDDPLGWAARVRERSEDTFLVSHLPFLPKLFSLLVCGYLDESIIAVPTASVICIARESGLWSLQWMITPDLLPPHPADDMVLV